MIDRHSTTAHAAYLDLLRSLQDEQISNIRGTPTRVARGGKVYWYDSFRIGSDVRKTYIGEESPMLLERLDRLKVLRQETDERRRHRRRLVAFCARKAFRMSMLPRAVYCQRLLGQGCSGLVVQLWARTRSACMKARWGCAIGLMKWLRPVTSTLPVSSNYRWHWTISSIHLCPTFCRGSPLHQSQV